MMDTCYLDAVFCVTQTRASTTPETFQQSAIVMVICFGGSVMITQRLMKMNNGSIGLMEILANLCLILLRKDLYLCQNY